MAGPKVGAFAVNESLMYYFYSNYGPTIRVQKVAASKGCDQVLWLFGDNHEVIIMSLGTVPLQ